MSSGHEILTPEIISEWLKPDLSTVILCRNVVDIMRMRIYLHEILEPRKSALFNVQFLTSDLWIKKLIPFAEESQKILSNNIILKAVLLKASEKIRHQTENETLKTLLSRPGFKNELPVIWYIYSWNKKLSPGDNFNKSGGKSPANFLQEFFRELDEALADTKLTPVNEFLINKQMKLSGNQKLTDQVICFFPTVFNAIEDVKMQFLQTRSVCSWKFVLHDTVRNSHQLPLFYTQSKSQITVVVKSPVLEKMSYDNWKLKNTDFFNISSSTQEKKIWMADNTHDEYHMIAKSVQELITKGIKPHRIFILYTSSQYIPLLEFAFKNSRLKLNHPEKTYSVNRPVISLFLFLLNIFKLRENSTPVLRNQLIDFVHIPVLKTEIPPHDLKNRRQLAKLIYQHFLVTDEIILSTNPKIYNKLPPELADFLILLGNEYEQLLKINSFQDKLYYLQKIFLKYISSEFNHHQAVIKQIEEIEKIIYRFLHLQIDVNIEFSPEFLFDLLYNEVSNLKLKVSEELLPEKPYPEVYARNISESVHSPVDYLFICGLGYRAFPLKNEHPAFLSESGIRNASLDLLPEEQLVKISRAMLLVQKGICFSFNLDKDPTPSDLIFEHVPFESDGALNKKEFVSTLPLYNRNNPSVIKGLPEILEYGTRTTDPDRRSANIDSFAVKINGNRAENYKDYTGQGSSVSPDKITSSRNIENLSACPRFFYYDKVLAIKQPPDYSEIRFPGNHIFKGDLFHHFAKEWSSYLIDNFPALQYKFVSREISGKNLDKKLSELFEKACQNSLDDFNLEYQKLSGPILLNYYQQFSKYFKRFLYHSENQYHILSDCYPVAAEIKFSNLSLDPFIFNGKIDKIDYNPVEKTIYITDYKTGNSKNIKNKTDDILSLKAFQIPLYMRAAIERRNEFLIDVPSEYISGAYEVIGKSAHDSSFKLIEFKKSKSRYSFSEIFKFFDELQVEKFSFLKDLLDLGYFFTYGHKEKQDPQKSWANPCIYCGYSAICDRSPFEVMLARVASDPSGSKFIDLFSKAEYLSDDRTTDSIDTVDL